MALACAAPPASASYEGSVGQIAYLKMNGALFVDDPFDTEPERQVAPAPPSGQTPGGLPHSAPAWSPDGTRIAYTELVEDPIPGSPDPVYHPAVFVVDQDGGNRVQVTDPPDFRPNSCDTCDDGGLWADWAPTWSPDGSKVAFIRLAAIGEDASDYDTRGYNIWVANVAGGGAQQLTHMEGDEAYVNAVWSPDGDKIAAVLADAGGHRIVTVNAAGGSPTTLAGPGNWTGEIDWTPDGDALVATRFAGTEYELVRIEEAGGAQTPLGTTQLQRLVRATPDGNGALYLDCADGALTDCGLHTRRFDDPGGDLHSDEPLHELWAPAPAPGPATGPMPGARTAFDVQAQQLPVIFVPGFLGSEIECGGETVWPKPAGDLSIDFPRIALNLDGTTDANCQGGAGPSGDAVASFDAGPISQPVYGPTADYMTSTFRDSEGGQRGYVYGWDWRKAPQASLAGLDALIDQAISTGVAERQGVERVALYGHSYGGLLIRTYLDDPQRADRVERVVTVGTPWWGSPKAIFPLAVGIETPEGGPGIDWFADNDQLRDFARNLAGIYQLFPSAPFGPWLQRNGVVQNQAGVTQTVFDLGGNTALLAQARQNHEQIYDQFFDDGGRIDVRAIVGTGLPTFGTVNLIPAAGQVSVGFVNGDHTVPGTSATQDQTVGAEHPSGDPSRRVHVQEICGVEHMEQSSSPRVLDRYEDFLDRGRRPRRTEGTCSFSGFAAKLFTGLDFEGTSITGASASTVRARAFAGPPMTLQEAAFARLIDVAAVPGQWIVAMSDRQPVALTFEAEDLVLELEPISDAGSGPAKRYGPMSGTIEIAPPAAPGGSPVVTDDGVAVVPEDVDPGPGPGPGDGGPGDGGGEDDGGAGTGGATPGEQALTASLGRVGATRLSALLKSGLRVRVSCSAACRGTVALGVDRALARRLGLTRSRRGGPVGIGKAGVSMAQGGARTVRVRVAGRAKPKLRRARRLSVRVSASLVDGQGRSTTVVRRVRVRR